MPDFSHGATYVDWQIYTHRWGENLTPWLGFCMAPGSYNRMGM